MKKQRGVATRGRLGAIACLMGCIGFLLSGVVLAAGGLSDVASSVTGNLDSVAKLITAGSYIAGFAFGVAAIVKFKAHKDNPTQVMISQPIVLLFVAAGLIFIPSVFKTTGATLFTSGSAAGVSGTASF